MKKNLIIKYLNKVMLQTNKVVYVGGHSKGGNQAVYSSIHTNIINTLRIKKIFTHDGPGFPIKIFNSNRYKIIKNKISKTVPSTSIVGMLLYSREEYKIALEKFYKCIKLHPSSKVYHAIARCFYEINKPVQALVYLNLSIRISKELELTKVSQYLLYYDEFQKFLYE